MKAGIPRNAEIHVFVASECNEVVDLSSCAMYALDCFYCYKRNLWKHEAEATRDDLGESDGQKSTLSKQSCRAENLGSQEFSESTTSEAVVLRRSNGRHESEESAGLNAFVEPEEVCCSRSRS